MNREELAWAAGFFSGEGSTFCSSTKGRWVQLNMSVTQAGLDGREVLVRFRKALNGVGSVTTKPVGRSNPQPNWKPVYTWQARSIREVIAATGFMWLFLSRPKQLQIKNAVEKWKAHRKATGVKTIRRAQ